MNLVPRIGGNQPVRLEALVLVVICRCRDEVTRLMAQLSERASCGGFLVCRKVTPNTHLMIWYSVFRVFPLIIVRYKCSAVSGESQYTIGTT